MLTTVIVIILLLSSFLSKVLIWRLKKPDNDYKFALVLFNSVFIIFLILNLFIKINIHYPDWIHIFLLYYLCIFAYLIAYTSIEGESPSIIIAAEVFNSKKKGIDILEIENQITNETFIYPRIESLIQNNLVSENNNKLRVSKKGNYTIKIMKLIKLYLGGETKTS